MRLTRDFIRRLPYVWPIVNVPIPFGGTPLFDDYLARGRVLRAMPFTFYYTPYLVTTLAHYSPVEYCRQLAGICALLTSSRMLVRRLGTRATWGVRTLHALRTAGMRQDLALYRRFGRLLETDAGFRTFHEGGRVPLPAVYHAAYERRLGRYAELLSRNDRTPMLDRLAEVSTRHPLPAAAPVVADPSVVRL